MRDDGAPARLNDMLVHQHLLGDVREAALQLLASGHDVLTLAASASCELAVVQHALWFRSLAPTAAYSFGGR